MSLTMGDLRRIVRDLGHLPDDMPVVMSKDGEGDAHSPLDSVKEGMYLAETTWSGEHYMTEEQRQGMSDPEDYNPAPEEAVRAVFLWPVN